VCIGRPAALAGDPRTSAAAGRWHRVELTGLEPARYGGAEWGSGLLAAAGALWAIDPETADSLVDAGLGFTPPDTWRLVPRRGV